MEQRITSEVDEELTDFWLGRTSSLKALKNTDWRSYCGETEDSSSSPSDSEVPIGRARGRSRTVLQSACFKVNTLQQSEPTPEVSVKLVPESSAMESVSHIKTSQVLKTTGCSSVAPDGSAAIGRGRGRGTVRRDAVFVPVEEIAAPGLPVLPKRRTIDSAPARQTALEVMQALATGERKLEDVQYYIDFEFTEFNPKHVLTVGSSGGAVYQSIQKCTPVQRYLKKSNSHVVSTKGAAKAAKYVKSPPETVDDFEPPGSFPVNVFEHQVPLVQEIVITYFSDLNDLIIKPKYNLHFILFTSQMSGWYDRNFQSVPTPEMKNFIKGGHYVVYSRKSRYWCRVALFNWKSNGEVMLELLDFGGFIHTVAEDMRLIRKVFCDFPIQATRAKIWLGPGVEINLSSSLKQHFKNDLEDVKKSFSAVTVDDDVDPATAKRISSIILLEFVNGKLRPYTFGNHFAYGHRMQYDKKE